jgi:hypothetical protein
MDLMQLRTVQWISLVGALAGILGLLALWESRYRTPVMLGVIVLSIVFVLAELQKDRISLLFSGISKFYRSFPQELNQGVFKQVQNEYCYLGITFSSVLNAFRAWHDSELKGNVRIRLLLTDPEATDVLEFQARYERDLFGRSLSAEEQRFVSDSVTRVKNASQLTLSTLATLSPRAPGIEVRLHREKLRKWMHAVDGQQLYVGMLRKGETGLQSPVIVLKPRHGKWSIFNHYLEEFESIWENAKEVTIANAGARSAAG